MCCSFHIKDTLLSILGLLITAHNNQACHVSPLVFSLPLLDFSVEDLQLLSAAIRPSEAMAYTIPQVGLDLQSNQAKCTMRNLFNNLRLEAGQKVKAHVQNCRCVVKVYISYVSMYAHHKLQSLSGVDGYDSRLAQVYLLKQLKVKDA